MHKRVFLHVGLPKSGTTYLQAVLAENKHQLMSEADLLYPGESWRDQVFAVRDVRQMRSRSKEQRAAVRGAWDRLADEINSWSGNVVVSMEWLCQAQPNQIRRILRDLDSATVEVMFTVRDLGRTIPASWQESIQNLRDWSWREFLDVICAGDPDMELSQRSFWRSHDTAALIEQWKMVLAPERLHVVTVPRVGAPPSTLWDRFCRVVGIDGSAYVQEGLATNESLGMESAEMLRRFTPRTRGSGVPKDMQKAIITQQLAKRGMSQRRSQEHTLLLPADTHEWVRARADQDIRGVVAAGVDVVGDLEELRPDLDAEPSPQPEDLEPVALLDAALDGLAISMRLQAEATLSATAMSSQFLAEQETLVASLTRRNHLLARRLAKTRQRVEQWQSQPVRSALRIHARRSRSVRAVAAVTRRWRKRAGAGEHAEGSAARRIRWGP